MSNLEGYTTFNSAKQKGKDFAYGETTYWKRQRKRKYQLGMLVSFRTDRKTVLTAILGCLPLLFRKKPLISLSIPAKNIDYIKRY